MSTSRCPKFLTVSSLCLAVNLISSLPCLLGNSVTREVTLIELRRVSHWIFGSPQFSSSCVDDSTGNALHASDAIRKEKDQTDRGPSMRHQRKAKTGPKKIKTVQLIGPKKLTRFERARVIGARALQISMGAPVLVDVSRSSRSPIDIALMELEQGVLPISIRRTLPDGESQNIPLKVLLEGEKRK